MTFPTRHRLAATVLLATTLAAGPALATEPAFQVPFTCDQVWQGSTDAEASPPQAIEFSRASYGNEPVRASAAGTIAMVRDLGYGSEAGRYIIVDHGDGWTSTYMNLASFEVAIGQHVAGGQPIATVGKSTPQQSNLYFEQAYYGMPESITFNGQKARYWGTHDYTSDNCLITHQGG